MTMKTLVAFVLLFAIGTEPLIAQRPEQQPITMLQIFESTTHKPMFMMPVSILKNNDDYYLFLPAMPMSQPDVDVDVCIARKNMGRIQLEPIYDQFERTKPYYKNPHVYVLKAKNTFKEGLSAGLFPQEIVFDVSSSFENRKSYDSLWMYKVLFNYEGGMEIEFIENRVKRLSADQDDIKQSKITSVHFVDRKVIDGSRSLSSPVFDRPRSPQSQFVGILTMDFEIEAFEVESDIDTMITPDDPKGMSITVIDALDLKMWIESRPGNLAD